jgi:hypothetical protein
MRSIIISIFLLTLLLFNSCEYGESEAIEPELKDSIVPNPPIDGDMILNLNQETSDDSIQVNFDIQKINQNEFNFQLEMQLYGESWIVSPLEKEFPYGCMRIEFDENEKLITIDQISEKPESKFLNDSNWDKPYRVISGATTLNQKMKIISKDDFTVKGNVFFVLEPICDLYQIDFQLFWESGNLRVEETPVRITK